MSHRCLKMRYLTPYRVAEFDAISLWSLWTLFVPALLGQQGTPWRLLGDAMDLQQSLPTNIKASGVIQKSWDQNLRFHFWFPSALYQDWQAGYQNTNSRNRRIVTQVLQTKTKVPKWQSNHMPIMVCKLELSKSTRTKIQVTQTKRPAFCWDVGAFNELIDGITEPSAQQNGWVKLEAIFPSLGSNIMETLLQPSTKFRNLIECHLAIIYINDPLASPRPISCCCG